MSEARARVGAGGYMAFYGERSPYDSQENFRTAKAALDDYIAYVQENLTALVKDPAARRAVLEAVNSGDHPLAEADVQKNPARLLERIRKIRSDFDQFEVFYPDWSVDHVTNHFRRVVKLRAALEAFEGQRGGANPLRFRQLYLEWRRRRA